LGKKRMLLILLLCVSLTAPLLGQVNLICRRELFLSGLLAWGMAIIAFVVIIRVSRQVARRLSQQCVSMLRKIPGVRILSALVGTMSVVSTRLLGRELVRKRVAWSSAAALALGHFHIHNSRVAYRTSWVPLLIDSASWMLLRGTVSRKSIQFVLTKALTGLGWYTHSGTRLIDISIVLCLGWRAAVKTRLLPRYTPLLGAMRVPSQ